MAIWLVLERTRAPICQIVDELKWLPGASIVTIPYIFKITDTVA